MPHPCILAEQTHDFIRSQKWEVAVLPFGATEPHNLHMPYGTDNFQVEEIGKRACQAACEAGAKVLLLPTMPFGVNTNHLKVPGALALSVTPTTLLSVITDRVDSLERQGVKKLVLLNGHGGNELKPLMRELFHCTGVFMCVCDWFRMATDQYPQIFAEPGEHADEVETSLGLAFFPHLASRQQEHRPGQSRRRQRRQGATPDGHSRCPPLGVPGTAQRGENGRAVSLLNAHLAFSSTTSTKSLPSLVANSLGRPSPPIDRQIFSVVLSSW
jgi:creatinine amidohydrolase/Fe(II)-dependent formamide hydrolase-like protein